MIDIKGLKKQIDDEPKPGHTYFGTRTVTDLLMCIEEAKDLMKHDHMIKPAGCLHCQWISKYFGDK